MNTSDKLKIQKKMEEILGCKIEQKEIESLHENIYPLKMNNNSQIYELNLEKLDKEWKRYGYKLIIAIDNGSDEIEIMIK